MPLAGIGCHYDGHLDGPSTKTFTQMGGKACHGSASRRSPNETHIFANLGDGTCFHSGVLAIRAAIAPPGQHDHGTRSSTTMRWP